MPKAKEKKYVVAFSQSEFEQNCGHGYWSSTHATWGPLEGATKYPAEDIGNLCLSLSSAGDSKWVRLDMPYFQDDTHDPLTVAFMTLGFSAAYAELSDEETDSLNSGKGQSEMISEIVAHAPFLDWVFNNHVKEGASPFDDFIYYYDIAEPFGAEFTKALASEETILSDLESNALAVKVLKAICQRTLSEENYQTLLHHV
jgi:hypothetical protein